MTNYDEKIKNEWDSYKELGTKEVVHKFVRIYVNGLYDVDPAFYSMVDFEIESFVRDYITRNDMKIYLTELDYDLLGEETIFISIREILKSTLRYILNLELNKHANKN